jgi:uncharacterized membrane protein
MSLRSFLFHHQSNNTAKIAAWLILVVGIIGTIDSTFLILQYIAAIATQGAPTPCSPSSIVNCTKTVQGIWGHVFIIPNPIFGMLWYTGWIFFGAARILKTEFSKNTRIFSGIILLLGLLFSYTLYAISVLELRGVCPFCLLSTTCATLIALGYLADETSYTKNLLTPVVRIIATTFQAISVVGFVIGLPVFLGIFIPPLLNPMEALTHWSFPAMIVLILTMAMGHIWAYRILRK